MLNSFPIIHLVNQMRVWHIQGRYDILVKSQRVWPVILLAEVLAANLHAAPVVGIL